LTSTVLSNCPVWAGTDFSLPSRGYEVPEFGDLLWYGRFGPLVGCAYQGDSTPVSGGPPAIVVTMMLIRVLVEEFKCQGLMGQKPVLECLSVR
jgi:hypothetical protein